MPTSMPMPDSQEPPTTSLHLWRDQTLPRNYHLCLLSEVFSPYHPATYTQNFDLKDSNYCPRITGFVAHP